MKKTATIKKTYEDLHPVMQQVIDYKSIEAKTIPADYLAGANKRYCILGTDEKNPTAFTSGKLHFNYLVFDSEKAAETSPMFMAELGDIVCTEEKMLEVLDSLARSLYK